MEVKKICLLFFISILNQTCINSQELILDKEFIKAIDQFSEIKAQFNTMTKYIYSEKSHHIVKESGRIEINWTNTPRYNEKIDIIRKVKLIEDYSISINDKQKKTLTIKKFYDEKKKFVYVEIFFFLQKRFFLRLKYNWDSNKNKYMLMEKDTNM